MGGADYVNVTDIGLLAYRSQTEPTLVRNGPVMSDTHYLRPFAELWLPYAARGSVRFELVDGKGRLRYADEAYYDLTRGRNTLLPDTWFPLRGKEPVPGAWSLRLQTEGVLLAEHPFEWDQSGVPEIRRLIESDGEISPELRMALEEQSLQAMSLSDLLEGQE